MTSLNPTELGAELLEEMEEDPRGHGYLDILKLLDEWGITGSLQGSDPIGYTVRIHPAKPSYPFTVPTRMELGPETVLGICRAVRELKRRLEI